MTEGSPSQGNLRAPPDIDLSTSWQFVLYGGIGDHVLWLSLLPAFRWRTKHPVVVYCDRQIIDLARLYAGRSYDYLIERASLDPRDLRRMRQQTGFAPGRPLLAWHWNFVGNEVHYLAGQDISIADLIRQLLRVPANAQLQPPVWPHAAHQAAAEHMRRLGLPVGRTLLMAPWAKSATASLPDQWWVETARHFAARGFTIATNVGNRARGFDRRGQDRDLAELPGTVAADVPLADLGPFAERCGAVLCARSGLTDLLAFARVRMCVIWPYDAGHERYYRKQFAVWSVRRVYDSRDVVELHPEVSQPFDPGMLPDWTAG